MPDVATVWRKKWDEDPYGGQYSEKKIAKFVKKRMSLSRKKDLLDVGCGGGLMLKNLPARKKVGLDYSAVRIREARKNVPEGKFVVGEAAKLPFENESFEKVLCHSTFMHYDEKYANRAISELERVCKKGGCILIGDVPDVDKYKYGRIVYNIRTAVFDLLGIAHYILHIKKFFEKKGYEIIQSPFNDRFYALKKKL